MAGCDAGSSKNSQCLTVTGVCAPQNWINCFYDVLSQSWSLLLRVGGIAPGENKDLGSKIAIPRQTVVGSAGGMSIDIGIWYCGMN